MRRLIGLALLGLGLSVNALASPLLKPGCAWILLHPEQGERIGSWGWADLEKRQYIDEHTRFNLASLSKQFTALAVLMLVRDGKLALDEPVARYWPDLPGELGKPTVRQVLRHTGGLPDYIEPLYQAGREHETVTVSETLEVLAAHPALRFTPGERFEYSNTGYFLLAQLVERVSGQPLSRFSQRYIFEPLGMDETAIVDRYPSALPQLARGYRVKDGQVQNSESSWEQTGDGQVHSSAADMWRWLQHLEQDTVLQSPEGQPLMGLRSLLTQSAPTEPKDNYQFGLETVQLGQDYAAWGHGGGWAGYHSFMAYSPERRQGAAVMCNAIHWDVRAMAERLLQTGIGQLEPIVYRP